MTVLALCGTLGFLLGIAISLWMGRMDRSLWLTDKFLRSYRKTRNALSA
jgi:hypothetical protein